MQEGATSCSEEQPTSGIDATVKLYVRLGNIISLSELKVHRLKLLAQHKDTGDFGSRLVQDCQKDIAAIDTGIRDILKREPCRGHVDACTPDKIAGWAQYVRYPEIPVTLAIYFDQELTAQIVADRYRRDLAKLGGSGQHSFEFIPPKELFLCSEVIEVRAPNGSVITGSSTAERGTET
jgi:hypothetical protein